MALPASSLRSALLALLCGAVVPLGFAPFGWYPIPVLALAVYFSVLVRLQPRDALLHGWFFGMAQFGVGVSWVYISVYLYGNAPLALSILVMLLLVAFLALYPALMAWAGVRLAGGSPARALLGLFPALWLLSEWLRSWVLSGFPWLNLGYSQVDGPLLGFAPLFGVYAVGWLTALCAGLLAYAVSSAGRARFLAASTLGLLVLAGYGLNRVHWTEAVDASLNSVLVQGNIAQDLKWRPDQQRRTLDRYLEMTRRHLDSDLVVWPETAVPAFYDQIKADFLDPLKEEMEQHGVSLVTGIPVLDRGDWQYFNAVISLDQPGRFYHKVHLVPFGEYLPLRDWLAGVLSFLPVPEADFSAGQIGQPLLQAAGYPVGASICFEIAFGEELISALPAAAFLINVSNDAWFGDSLAPHQHLEMARMRARETERYLLRATNTGISAIIDADGEWVARSRQFVADTIGGEVQPRRGATPYVVWGNWPVVIAGLLVVLAVAWRRRASTTEPLADSRP
jgi:apolipoprotein N-acyltransferase